MTIRAALAVSLSLLCITSNAEVFKCSGPNGPLLRNEPCQSDERTISVDGVPWKKIAAEAERKRILEAEAKQEAENRASAEAYKKARQQEAANQWDAEQARKKPPTASQKLEQTYRELPSSTRDYNPHTTEPCRGFVAEIRRLEQSPDFDRNRATRIELDNVMRLAMRLKCHF